MCFCWLLSWVLFLIGDAISRPMRRLDHLAWVYPAYNRIMVASSAVQGNGRGPWGPR